jgi:hypothetical protein
VGARKPLDRHFVEVRRACLKIIDDVAALAPTTTMVIEKRQLHEPLDGRL